MTISATRWGSPLAPRRALLIHGLTGSSDSWEGAARLLVAEGFFVLAPNLLGHAWRRGNDYRFSAIVDDLQPYFAMDMSYDVVIGHSLGGAVALLLLPFLPKMKDITVLLLDPAIEVSAETIDMYEKIFLQEVTSAKSADECMVENPAWSRRDCVLRALGLSMCDGDDVKDILQLNKPWSFSSLLKNIPANVNITILAADPKFGAIFHLEDVPQGVKNLNARALTGIGHCIQFECPEAIMHAIPLPRGKL